MNTDLFPNNLLKPVPAFGTLLCKALCIAALILLTPSGTVAAAQPDTVLQSSRNFTTYLDSLYMYAYFKHRLLLCDKRFKIPKQTRNRLFKSASMADSLVARVGSRDLKQYRYLLDWVKAPERPESDFSGTASATGPTICDLKDTLGYTAFQAQVTALRIRAGDAKRDNHYDELIVQSDSVIRLTPYFLTGLFQAKKKAVAERDTIGFLKLFAIDPYLSDDDRIRSDTSWTIARTATDKAFVRSCIARRSTIETAPRAKEPMELILLINRYAELQDKVSRALFTPRSAVQILLVQHKSRIRSIYMEIARETYTVFPEQLGQQLAKDRSMSPSSGNTIGYLILHMLQLNAYGREYPEALFEQNFRFLECLVYNRMIDIESYADYYDMYQTAVLHRKSVFGSGSRVKGNDFDDYFENTPETRANRLARNMVPESGGQ